MDSRQPKKPVVLPQLRKDISVAFNDYDLEGKPQWLIYDAGRNKFFLIGWLEYEIIERWKLDTPEKIVDSIISETTLEVDETDIERFADFLKRNYLIKQSGYDIHKLAKDQNLFKKDNLWDWLVSNYLFFRIPLVKPDAFLSRTRFIGDILFSPYTAIIMSILAIIALYLITNRWEEFVTTFPSVFNLQGLILAMFSFVIAKLCHELGHAYMCKRFNTPVPTLGIAFLVFWPVLYTDTTLSWSLTHKQRLSIAIAGIWVETYVNIIAALIWIFSDNEIIKTMAYISIAINFAASLLINASPFMRFDGYYVLADFLKMPNLQHRAFALTRWQIRHWLFGWNEPPPENFSKKLHVILIIYSITTWLYRLVIFLGIALLVYHLFAKAIGLVLFLIEIYYFILNPILNEFKFWLAYKSKFSLNIKTITTLSVASIIIILFFIPISTTLKLPATMSYMHAFLYAPEAGIIQNNLPPIGSKISANTPIVTIDSEKLDQAITETQLEYTKAVNQLRRATISTQFIEEKTVLLSDLKKLRSQYEKLLKIKEKLTLKVPFDGILAETDQTIHTNSYVKKNQWIADVIKPNSTIIEAFVSQRDVNFVKQQLQGTFIPANLSNPKVPVKVVSIEIMNAEQLDCRYSSELEQEKADNVVIETPCYNSSELGGEIATLQSPEGKYVPTQSVFRIVLKTDLNPHLHYVERGTVHLNTAPRSYASRLFYWVKSIFIQESGF